MERGHQADDRGLARSRGAHEGGDGARRGTERHALQDRQPGLVGESNVFERHLAAQAAERLGPAGVLVLRAFAQHFPRALEAGDRFGELRADRHHLA